MSEESKNFPKILPFLLASLSGLPGFPNLVALEKRNGSSVFQKVLSRLSLDRASCLAFHYS